jgi:c-di-GMP-binding flagellar brake protein YcgR
MDHRHERRKYVRVDIYAVTRYFCPFRNEEIGIQTRLADISEGGAKLLTFEEGIPVNTEVVISFLLSGPKEEVVTLKGTVRHTGLLEKNTNPSQNLYRAGVEFVEMTPKNQRAIRSYVESKSRK